MHYTLTADAEAMLLCCSHLAMPEKTEHATSKPYAPREWTELAKRIRSSSIQRPGNLLSVDGVTLQHSLGLSDAESIRLHALLSRGGQLAIELDHLAQLGIWALTRVDVDYPLRLKALLGGVAPPVLFGAGDKTTLERGFLAVVGSRDVDEHGARFARSVGAKCAQDEQTIVSGMSRGVDYDCMFGALDAGGAAIGVLADGLEKSLRSRKVREHVAGGRLTLVTPAHPRAGFSVGALMGRNKYIYCLAEFGLVIAASLEKGGTRAGAVEVLKSKWVPLFVRNGDNMPPGNRLLLQQGALPFDDTWLDQDTLLSQRLQEEAQGWSMAPVTPDAARIKGTHVVAVQLSLNSAAHSADHDTNAHKDLFPVIWPTLENVLTVDRTAEEVAILLCLETAQAIAWLKRAMRDGLATLVEGERYQIAPSNPLTSARPSTVEQLHIPLE